jgi:ubiquinone/menaquinone biosynthesis C-methylase UbiE
MDWHTRYTQQAAWTRDLRNYLFEKAGLSKAARVLEVGCGTGAILSDLSTLATLHGVDIDPAALTQCSVHVPNARLIRADALALPHKDECFDITYCHFLLLWVKDPSQALIEMKRVTRSGGQILAFAEPDYTNRIDEPKELEELGRWQTESLRRQGADPSFGSRLAESFDQVGISLLEAGPIQGRELMRDDNEREAEWAVIESDLEGFVAKAAIQKMKALDEKAWNSGERVLQVPVYFAAGRK